jgi:hypothetical protein
MPNLLFCIYCDSLDVFEHYLPNGNKYEYGCKDCYETWADDESELESSL